MIRSIQTALALLFIACAHAIIPVGALGAQPIEYDVVERHARDGRFFVKPVGTITTDGTLGVITSGNFIDWSITVGNPGGPFTLTPANSAVDYTDNPGGELIATPTSLEFRNIGSGSPDELRFTNLTPVQVVRYSSPGPHAQSRFIITNRAFAGGNSSESFVRDDYLLAGAAPPSNTAPTVSCPEPVTSQCNAPSTREVTLGAGLADSDGDALDVEWFVDGVSKRVVSDTTAATDVFTHTFGLGSSMVTVVVDDGTAEPVSCSTMVTILSMRATEHADT